MLEIRPQLACNLLQMSKETYIHDNRRMKRDLYTHIYIYVYTANPTWGDIFECCFKAQSSKLERLLSLKRGKRDFWALKFELSKKSPQVGLAVCTCSHVYTEDCSLSKLTTHPDTDNSPCTLRVIRCGKVVTIRTIASRGTRASSTRKLILRRNVSTCFHECV